MTIHRLYLPSHAAKQAFYLLLKGMPIIPLKARSKVPFDVGLSEPVTRYEMLSEYARSNPDLNYGVVTGAASGLYVVDVDGLQGEESLARYEAEYGPLPETVVVLTGRGRHIWFKDDGFPMGNRTHFLGDGVDFRGDGGYVVAPGSVHDSGTVYAFAPNLSLRDLPRAGLPAALIAKIREKPTRPAPPALQTQSTANALTEGGRNAGLTSLAGKLHNTGIGEKALIEALSAHNTDNCRPPLDDAEVATIARSVARYPVHPSPTLDEAENLMDNVLATHFAGGEHLLSVASGEFYRFVGTHWAVLPTSQMKRVVLETIKAMPLRKGQATSSLMGQALTLLSARTARDGDPLRFEADPLPVIAVRNGELWLEDDGSVELRPHSSRSYQRHLIDIDFDPKAQAPRYDRALLEIFGKEENPKACAAYWNRVAGYALQGERRHPVVIIGLGEGGNGKTSLFRLLTAVIGHTMIAAKPIKEIEGNRFALAGLVDKRILLDDDVQSGTKLPDGQLKRLSEAKLITAERKFGPEFQFVARVLPILLCNNPPSMGDISHGMRRRIQAIPFARTFTEAEADLNLVSYILANEASGVLNRFLEGLQAVMRAGWLLKPPSDVMRATEGFLEEANPLPRFIKECCVKAGSVEVRLLYEHFDVWREASRITFALQRHQFGQNLRRLGYVVKHGHGGELVLGLALREGA